MEKFRVMFKPKEITATTPFSAYNKNKRHLVIVNSMKQIILIFCLGLILNSCMKEEPLAVSDVEANLVFNLKTSGSIYTKANAASTANLDDIDEITTLVFEGGGSSNYLYRRSGIIPVNNQFSANILLTNDPVKIHIFANPDDGVNSVNFNGMTESDVISSLTTDVDLNGGANRFPMHGTLSLPNIIADVTVGTPVYLLRAIALVDVNAGGIAQNIFNLDGAYVYNTPNNGRLVSEYRVDDNGDPSTPIVTAPTMPTLFTTLIGTPSIVNVVGNVMSNQLFIYENSKISAPTSRVVISGIFNSSGTTSYYPVDFIDANGAAIDILRNHLYLITITSITGSGYSNVTDAANGVSIDISADITHWNSIEMGGDISPSETTLTAPSKVHLDHTSNSGSYIRTIAYSSNRDVELSVGGVKVPFPGSGTSVNLDIPATNSWLTQATWSPTDNLGGELVFTHSTSAASSPESYIVTLKSGGITRNMEVFVSSI